MTRLRILLLCLLAWAWTPLAWGHASLLSSVPPRGAVLDQGPATVELEFSEPVSATVMRLVTPDGQIHALPPTDNRGTAVSISVPEQTGDGTYLLNWRVVSADGHPIGGTLDYSIGGPAESASARSAEQSLDAAASTRHFLIWLVRWLGYLCLFFVVGSAVFRALPNPGRPASRYLPLLAGAGLLLLPIAFSLQGLDLLAAPWSALQSAAVWEQAWASPYALTLILMALALLGAIGAQRLHRPAARTRAGLACLLLSGLALAASGHASAAPPAGLSRGAVLLHTITAIAWIGSLIPLLRTLRTDAGPPKDQVRGTGSPRAQQTALALFSRWISPIVAVLVLSGLSLIWLQFQRPSDLWLTAYGQVLAAKLLLVALVFCLAAWNRWRLTQAVLAGDAHARQSLRRSIRLEVALAILILAIVSLWRFTPPPRSVDQVSAALVPPPAISLSNHRAQAQIQPGTALWTIRLSKLDGSPLKAQELTLSLDNPEAGLETIRSEATPQADGLWQAQVPALPAIGHWEASLDILLNEFEQTRLSPSAPDN